MADDIRQTAQATADPKGQTPEAFGKVSRGGEAVESTDQPQQPDDFRIKASGTTGYSLHKGDVAADVSGHLAGVLHRADHAMGIALDMGLFNRPQDNVSPADNVSDRQIAQMRDKLGEIREVLFDALEAEVKNKEGFSFSPDTACGMLDIAGALDRRHGRDDTDSFGVTDRIAGLSGTMQNAVTYLQDGSMTPQKEMTDALCAEVANRDIPTVQQEDRTTVNLQDDDFDPTGYPTYQPMAKS